MLITLNIAFNQQAAAQCSSCTAGTSAFTWYNGTTGARWDIAQPANNTTATNVYSVAGPSGNSTVTVKIADLPIGNGSMVVNSGECALLASAGGGFSSYFTGTTSQTSPGACASNTVIGGGYLQIARSTAINSNVPASAIYRVTFKFSTPIYLNKFTIVDIDYYGAGTPAGSSTSNYQDRVRVRAANNGALVNLTATNSNVGSPSIVTIGGSGSTEVTGTSIYANNDGNDINPGDPTDQRSWMFVSSGCVYVDSLTVDYDNRRSNNELIQIIGLGGFDFCYKSVTVSGNVYDDHDGISNGFTGSNKIFNPSTRPLFAYLVGANGLVAATPVAVTTTGTYTFPNVTSGDYSVAISTTNTASAAIGVAPPAINLPADWIVTGEIIGTGTTHDGTPNGKSAVFTVDAEGANITNVNFGIEMKPSALAQSYDINQPTLNQTLTLNGTGTASSPAPLKGSDFEDGTLGSGKSFRIVSVSGLNGNTLYYNGTQITGATTIANYNPSLLTLKFTGLGSNNARFTYSSIDAASQQSAAVTYAISWLSVLPIQSWAVAATLEGNKVQVKWTTTDEHETSRFYVERSGDQVGFKEVASIAASGNTTGTSSYAVQDDITTAEGDKIYYRIKLVDRNGDVRYSPVIFVKVSGVMTVSLKPNPFIDQVQLTTYSNQKMKVTFTVTDMTGKTVQRMEKLLEPGNNQFTIHQLNNLPNGMYLLKTVSEDGSLRFINKIIKGL